MDDDWLDFVRKDDASIESALESQKRLELLERIAKNTDPSDAPTDNDWYTIVKVDMSIPNDSMEVYRCDGTVKPNSVVIPAMDIEYWYELEYGKKVMVEAGLIMEITQHVIDMLRITNTETADETMEIVISGVTV